MSGMIRTPDGQQTLGAAEVTTKCLRIIDEEEDFMMALGWKQIRQWAVREDSVLELWLGGDQLVEVRPTDGADAEHLTDT